MCLGKAQWFMNRLVNEHNKSVEDDLWTIEQVEADAEARPVHPLPGRGEEHSKDLVAQMPVRVAGHGDGPLLAQAERLEDVPARHHSTGTGGEITGGKTTMVDSAIV